MGAGLTDAQIGSALAGARPVPYWLDQPAAPPPEALPPLAGRTSAQLAVIGGGFTGLWTALQAKEADPGRDVVLLEARRVAWAGTGRNGGFCSASLTHGLSNGQDRFPGELADTTRFTITAARSARRRISARLPSPGWPGTSLQRSRSWRGGVVQS